MIIFTNGCFDILHTGHLDFLQKVDSFRRQQHSDWGIESFRVIVGINSDESTRRLKGAGRPVFNQEDRKRMLEATRYVDEVIIYYEDTAVELIKQLKPNVYFKGWDYFDKIKTAEQIAVEELGGEVRLTLPPSFKVRHTSEIIRDMLKERHGSEIIREIVNANQQTAREEILCQLKMEYQARWENLKD